MVDNSKAQLLDLEDDQEVELRVLYNLKSGVDNTLIKQDKKICSAELNDLTWIDIQLEITSKKKMQAICIL